jgi:hypothetical protein
MAEYNTQVEDDQFIFPQSLAGRPSMWQGGPFSECHDGFKGWALSSALAHLIFDLRPNLAFGDLGFQQADSAIHDFSR